MTGINADTPTHALAAVAFIFDTNDRMIRQTLHDLPAEALWQRPTEAGNPIMWILGHITQTRAGLLTRLGEPVDTGWGDLFKRGAKVGDAAAYPPAQEIKSVGADLTRRLREKLRSVSDEQLAEPVTNLKIPNINTLGDALAFFAFHEAYHIGQLGYVKKCLGYTPVAG